MCMHDPPHLTTACTNRCSARRQTPSIVPNIGIRRFNPAACRTRALKSRASTHRQQTSKTVGSTLVEKCGHLAHKTPPSTTCPFSVLRGEDIWEQGSSISQAKLRDCNQGHQAKCLPSRCKPSRPMSKTSVVRHNISTLGGRSARNAAALQMAGLTLAQPFGVQRRFGRFGHDRQKSKSVPASMTCHAKH